MDPDPTKGAILIQNGEDGLLHFIWKNRSTNDAEEVCCVVFALWVACARSECSYAVIPTIRT